MSFYKTDRITTLPHLLNKKKLEIYTTYFHNLLLTKNKIRQERLKDKELQKIIFYYKILNKEEKRSLFRKYRSYKEKNKIFTSWELQKFFNQDYIEKEKNRYEQRIDNYHYKIYELKYKNIKVKSNKSKIKKEVNKEVINNIEKKKYYHQQKEKSLLGNYIELRIKNEYYHSKYYQETIEKLKLKIIQKNPNFLERYQQRIENLIQLILTNLIFKKKPIEYNTPSMIKSGHSGLGQNHFRIAKDLQNTLYHYYYCLDTYDFDGKKTIINIPLRYNQQYHKDFKHYTNLKSHNKFVKRKNKLQINNNIKSENKNTIKTIKTIKKGKEIENEIVSLYEKEHCISFSQNSKRLTINLIRDDERNYQKHEITKKNSRGIDVGGNIKNSLVDSENNVLSFTFLKKIIKEFNVIDTIDNTTVEGKELKKKKLGKITRKIEGNLNKIIKTYLDTCHEKGIKHISFEKLDVWNLKGKSKENNQKLNRIFRLLRRTGLVNLFRKQRRNRNIFIHTIPSYYTSKLCNHCKSHILEKKDMNTKNRTICCPHCGNSEDRDFNRAKNIKEILGRFPNEFCSLDNNFYEFNRKKYLKKEFVKNTLLTFNEIKPIHRSII